MKIKRIKNEDTDNGINLGELIGAPAPVSQAQSVSVTGNTSHVQNPDDGGGNPTTSSGSSPSQPTDTPTSPDLTKVSKLTPKMKRLLDMAVVTELTVGTPIEVIAKNYNLSMDYVSKVRADWMKACKIQESFDYKHEMKVLAIDAIRDGLLHKSGPTADPYKRMGGGIRVMQGIGEFQQGVTNVAILQKFDNVPKDMRSRYLTSSPEDEGVVIPEIPENVDDQPVDVEVITKEEPK